MWRYERPALAGCLALLGLCGAAVAALLCAGLALGLPGLDLPEGSASTPAGPPPTSVVVPLGIVVLEDDFSDRGSGWFESTDEFTTHAYDDGAYRLAVHGPNYDAWAYAGLDLTDALVSVQAEAVAGPADRAFGLICRLQDDHNYYAAYVTADGWAAIFRKENDDFVSLLPGDWVETDAVRASDRNDLAFACLGDRLQFSVNGVVAAEARDSTFAHGDVGLLAATFEDPGTDVRFDDFVVRQP
jgi:hypothetical protein